MGGTRGSSWELRPKGQQRLGVWQMGLCRERLKAGVGVLPLATVPSLPRRLCFSPNSQKGAARSLCKISNLTTPHPRNPTPTPPFGIRVLEGS